MKLLGKRLIPKVSKKILVVTESKQLGSALSHGLTRHKLVVRVEPDALRAVGAIKREEPVIVVLDFSLTKKAAHDILSEVKKSSWGYNTPFIVIAEAEDMPNTNYSLHYDIRQSFTKESLDIEAIFETITQIS